MLNIFFTEHMQFEIYFSCGSEIFKKIKFLLDLFMGRVKFSQGYRKPFREDSLIAMRPKISSTHLIDLRRMKDCVNLGAAQWF